jgi:DNA-binding response OmpR family regulator
MKHLLVIDENTAVTDFIRDGLAHAFSVFATIDVIQAYDYAAKNCPLAVLVDMKAELSSEFGLCRRLRDNALTRHIPILMMLEEFSLTSMNQAYERGSDDYISKPVNLSELELRLKAHIRRAEESVPRHPIVGNLVLVPERHEIKLDGKTHRLSPLEFQLLRVFILNPNRSISRNELLKTVWQDVAVSNRTVDVHVSSLRRKLAGSDFAIDSIYGSGYILRPMQTGAIQP